MAVQQYAVASGSGFASSSTETPPRSPEIFRSQSIPRGRLDPKQIYPAPWHPYISIVFDTYLASMAHEYLDAGDPATMEMLRTHWIPFIFTDIALLHATLLVAATLFGSPPGPRFHTIDLLHLKGLAISALNDALQDPLRSTSDQIIGAVAAMAQYEAFWGDKYSGSRSYRLHMQGLVNLVHMKGGLEALGLDGLLERFLLAIDHQASRATDSELFFLPTESVSSIYHQGSRNRFHSIADGGETSQ
ncbi:hypothetical protein MBLNU459_g3796t1 [Dothideomycetes sp. NU459]